MAYAVPNVLRSLLFRPHHEVGKCFGNNYEHYFSWLLQSLMFCEASCSDHITKWENVLETLMNNISVGLCSPYCFANFIVPTTSRSGKMFWKQF